MSPPQDLPPNLRTDVGAYQDAKLRALAADPTKTVLTVEHDFVNEPWRVERLRPLLESLAARVAAFGDDVDDFKVRKTCLDDPEVLAFQRQHPKLYWLLTDRKMVRDARFRGAVTGLLHVRSKVENGEVEEGRDADAMATKSVLAALGTR